MQRTRVNTLCLYADHTKKLVFDSSHLVYFFRMIGGDTSSGRWGVNFSSLDQPTLSHSIPLKDNTTEGRRAADEDDDGEQSARSQNQLSIARRRP